MSQTTKTNPDQPNVVQLTKIEKDNYILIGTFNKKQLETLVEGLQRIIAGPATGWRRKFQKLAKVIVEAYDRMKGK
jgi:hypothetical protein